MLQKYNNEEKERRKKRNRVLSCSCSYNLSIFLLSFSLVRLWCVFGIFDIEISSESERKCVCVLVFHALQHSHRRMRYLIQSVVLLVSVVAAACQNQTPKPTKYIEDDLTQSQSSDYGTLSGDVQNWAAIIQNYIIQVIFSPKKTSVRSNLLGLFVFIVSQ